MSVPPASNCRITITIATIVNEDAIPDDAAERAGVGKFVYVSYSGNITEPSPLALAKRGYEARLRGAPAREPDANGDPASIVVCGSMAESGAGFDAVNGKARVYGPGTAKVSYVSAFDVAAFAVAVAARDYTTRSTTLDLGGRFGGDRVARLCPQAVRSGPAANRTLAPTAGSRSGWLDDHVCPGRLLIDVPRHVHSGRRSFREAGRCA